MLLIFKSFLLFILLFTFVPMVFASSVTFTDMRGNEVMLSNTTKRVVTLPMPAGSLFMSLDGGAEHLVGMHPEAFTLMQRTLLSRIYPQASHVRSDITQSGFTPNIETMLTLQPDLIWQWGHMGDELITPLKNAGLPVAALLYGTEAQTREWITLMGVTLGKQRQAAAQLQWRSDVEASIRKITSALTDEERAKVLYLARYYPQYRVQGKSGNFEYDVTLAGGVNVFSAIGNSPSVNVEQILAWNPDVILLNNFETELTPQVIYDDPMLSDLSAVRHHRVYKIPAGGYLWDPPNQESPLYWQWLSEILHPQKFNWPMRELISRAYMLLYGYSPSQQDMDDVLHVNLNKKAAGYERFAK